MQYAFENHSYLCGLMYQQAAGGPPDQPHYVPLWSLRTSNNYLMAQHIFDEEVSVMLRRFMLSPRLPSGS